MDYPNPFLTTKLTATGGTTTEPEIEVEDDFFRFDDETYIQVPIFAQASFVFYIALIFLFGIPGNIIIIILYCRAKHKNSCDVFIEVIACTDLIVCAMAPPIYLIIEFVDKSVDSDVFVKICAIGHLLQLTAMAASTLLITLLSLDRYVRVCHSSRQLISLRIARYLSAFCVMFSFLITMIPHKHLLTESCHIGYQHGIPAGYLNIYFALYVICFVVVPFAYGNVIWTIERKISAKKRMYDSQSGQSNQSIATVQHLDDDNDDVCSIDCQQRQQHQQHQHHSQEHHQSQQQQQQQDISTEIIKKQQDQDRRAANHDGMCSDQKHRQSSGVDPVKTNTIIESNTAPDMCNDAVGSKVDANTDLITERGGLSRLRQYLASVTLNSILQRRKSSDETRRRANMPANETPIKTRVFFRSSSSGRRQHSNSRNNNPVRNRIKYYGSKTLHPFGGGKNQGSALRNGLECGTTMNQSCSGNTNHMRRKSERIQRERLMRDRKVTVMLVIMTAVFICSWLPIWTLFLVDKLDERPKVLSRDQPKVSTILLVAVFRYFDKLFLVNFASNFFIYYSCNISFRLQVRMLLPAFVRDIVVPLKKPSLSGSSSINSYSSRHHLPDTPINGKEEHHQNHHRHHQNHLNGNIGGKEQHQHHHHQQQQQQ